MSSTSKWTFQHSNYGEDLRMFQVRKDHYVHDGHTFVATVLEARDSANVVAITENLEIVLVDIFRYGSQSHSLELPGGIVDEGEEPLFAAKRELREETGYEATDWAYLGYCYANPVFMDSKVHHFIAYHAVPIQEATPELEEDITLHLMPLEQVATQIFQHIHHPHSISALCRAIQIKPKTQL